MAQISKSNTSLLVIDKTRFVSGTPVTTVMPKLYSMPRMDEQLKSALPSKSWRADIIKNRVEFVKETLSDADMCHVINGQAEASNMSMSSVSPAAMLTSIRIGAEKPPPMLCVKIIPSIKWYQLNTLRLKNPKYQYIIFIF